MLVNNKCECPVGFYLFDNNCLSCSLYCDYCLNSSFCLQCRQGFILKSNACICPNRNFIVVDNECICKLGYFFDNGTCNKCHDSCLECFGPSDSDCYFCNNGYLYLKDQSKCVHCNINCEDCMQNLNSTCQNCDEVCLNCPENSKIISNSCICNSGYYLSNKSCLKCDSQCSTCFDSSNTSCLSCKNYLLKNICFKKCPYGYNPKNSKCLISTQQDSIFSFIFNELNSITSNKNTDFNLTQCQNSSYSKFPLILPQRGLYFSDSSCINLIKTEDRDLFSLDFTINFWLKPSTTESTLFLIQDPNNSTILSIYLKNSDLFFSILINEKNYKLKANQKILSQWTSLSLKLNYKNISNIEIHIDKQVSIFSNFSQSPFIEPANLLYYLGLESNLSPSFKGFIFKFELGLSLDSFYHPEIYSFYCRPGENNSTCLTNCSYDEFFNNLTQNCEKCNEKCQLDCRDFEHCGVCIDDHCNKCESFESETCIWCETGFVSSQGICLSCEEVEKGNHCLSCDQICKNCKDSEICDTCKNFAKSESCVCGKGFKSLGGVCYQKYFKVSLKVNQENCLFFELGC